MSTPSLLVQVAGDGLAPAIVDITLKSVFLGVVAGIIAGVARGASAAVRHQVWFIAVAGVLALPVLSVGMPAWRVLPEWAGLPAKAAKATTIGSQVSETGGTHSFTTNSSSTTLSRVFVRENGHLILSVTWIAGVLIFAARLAGGLMWLRFSVNKAQAPSDQLLIGMFERACRSFGVRNVELRVDSRRPVPFVCGIARRFLVLPEGVREWPEAQLEAVLRHELAHIKRRDPVALFISSVSCAVHWFNPLVWLAARELALECEKACDDYVLNGSIEPTDYATHLISASWFVHESAPAALAITRRSQLERRVVAALEHGRNRAGVTAVGQTVAFCIALALVVPLAIVQSRQEPARRAKFETSVAAEKETEKSKAQAKAIMGANIAIEVETNGTSAITLDQFEFDQIARALDRIAAKQVNSLVLIRHVSGTNYVGVVKLAQLCRSRKLRCTFVSNFSLNTAPHLPPELQALPSRKRFVAINVDANGKFGLRMEGFTQRELLATLDDLKSTPSQVLVRSQRAFFEFGEVHLALNSAARGWQ